MSVVVEYADEEGDLLNRCLTALDDQQPYVNKTIHGVMESAEQYYLDQFHKQTEKMRVYNKVEQFSAPTIEARASNGEARLRKFEEILENGYKYKPHKFQKGFHKEATKALAPSIVGPEDWERIGPRIIQERGYKTIAQMVAAKAPRRFGKSVGLAMIAIAYAEVMPGHTQSIFSTGRRASKNLLDICYKLAVERGLSQYIDRFNQEELIFLWDKEKKIYSKIFSYPANAKVIIFFFVNIFILLFSKNREIPLPLS